MSKKTYLDKIDDFLVQIYSYLNYVIFIVSIAGVILNVFHLLVLFRKSMRQLTINIFMIGIAICDFSQMIAFVVVMTSEFYHIYKTTQVSADCYPPQSYLEYKINHFFTFISNMSPKLAVWLGVSLAILRASVIRHPTNSSIQNFIYSKHGIRILLTICLPYACYFICDYTAHSTTITETWELPPECTNSSESITYTLYYTEYDESSFRISLFIDGVMFKLIPSILLPLFTIVLLYEMKKTRKVETSQSFQNSNRKDRSTKLVTFVTITFLMSTVPLGMLYIIKSIFLKSIVISNFANKLQSIFILISIINGTLHFLICFFMSSQYRNTVKNAVGWKSKTVARASEIQKEALICKRKCF